MFNFQYVTAETIHQSIARRFKNKNFGISDIASWCAECLREEVQPFMVRDLIVKNHPLEVKNKQALLPVNIAYLKDVKHEGERIEYKVNGAYIFFRHSIKTVHISYAGLPIDNETGYMLIPYSSVKACRLYCIKNLVYEEYISGKMHYHSYQQLERDLNEAILQAQSSHDDMDMAEQIEHHQIMHNMVFKVGELPESLL